MTYHEWLVFIWIIANGLTGLAYFHIPIELYYWTHKRPLIGMKYVAMLFVAFIAGCGLHHITMLRHAWHHPTDELQVIVDSMMAAASLLTSIFLFSNRQKITKIVQVAENYFMKINSDSQQ